MIPTIVVYFLGEQAEINAHNNLQFSCAPSGKINVYFLNTVYLLVWLHFLKDNLKRFIPTLVSHLLLVRLALLMGGLFPAGLKALWEGGAREKCMSRRR